MGEVDGKLAESGVEGTRRICAAAATTTTNVTQTSMLTTLELQRRVWAFELCWMAQDVRRLPPDVQARMAQFLHPHGNMWREPLSTRTRILCEAALTGRLHQHLYPQTYDAWMEAASGRLQYEYGVLEWLNERHQQQLQCDREARLLQHRRDVRRHAQHTQLLEACVTACRSNHIVPCTLLLVRPDAPDFVFRCHAHCVLERPITLASAATGHATTPLARCPSPLAASPIPSPSPSPSLSPSLAAAFGVLSVAATENVTDRGTEARRREDAKDESENVADEAMSPPPPPLPVRTLRHWHESRCERSLDEHSRKIENVVLRQERQREQTFDVRLVSDVTCVSVNEWRRMYARATQRGSRSADAADKMINVVESLRRDPGQLARCRSRQFRTPHTLWHRDRYDPESISAWHTEQLTSPLRKHTHECENGATFTVAARIIPHFECPPQVYFSCDALAAMWPNPPSPKAIHIVYAFCFRFVASLGVV